MFEKIWEMLTSKRFQSFYWRSGMMVTAGFLDLVVENLSDLEIGAQVTIVVGLIFGEISKHIYNKVNNK